MKLDALVEFDHRVSSHLRLGPEHGFWWKLSTLMAHSGDSWFNLPVLILVWLIDRGQWHNLAAIQVLGICGVALIVGGIKLIFRRQRPAGEWGGVYRKSDPLSFPSGHAARVALLTVLVWNLAPVWLAVIFLIWAGFVCLARVTTGVHYLLDVIGGVLVGIIGAQSLLLILPLVRNWFSFLFV